jgi:hypothetical protein
MHVAMPLPAAGTTGRLGPSSSGTPAGCGSVNQITSSGVEAGPSHGPAKPNKGKGKGKGKTKGKALKAQQGSSLSGSSEAAAVAGSGTTTTATGAVQAAESQADRRLRILRHDGRGLIVAAVDAWALAVKICRQLGRTSWIGSGASATSPATVLLAHA